MDGHPPKKILTTEPLAQSSRSARTPDETGFDSQVPGDTQEAAIEDAYARFLIDSHHRDEDLTRRYEV